MTRFALFLVFLSIFSISSAQAAIDSAGADHLKTVLQKFYDQKIAEIRRQGVDIQQKGDIAITPKETYYAATFPHLTIISPVGTMDFGSISMNVLPGAQDGQWKIAAALPSPIFLTEGQDRLSLTFGQQKILFVLDERYDTWTFSDASIQNTALKYNDTQDVLKIASISNKSSYTPSGPDVFSGSNLFDLSSLVFSYQDPKNQKENVHLKLDQMHITGTVDALNLGKWTAYNKKINDLMEAGLAPDKINSSKALSAMMQVLIADGFQLADGGDGKMTLSGLEIVAGSKDPISIAEISYDAGIKGLRADKSTGYIGGAMKGFKGPGAQNKAAALLPIEVAPYLPDSYSFKFGFKDLPHQELIKQIMAMAESGMKAAESAKTENPGAGKQQAQMMAMQAMMSFPSILAKAGTVFTLDTDVVNPKYNVKGTGEFKTDAAAIYSGTGTAKIIFAGLDQVITELQTMAKDPQTDPAIVPNVNKALGGLIMMQMSGQQGMDAAGKPARLYELALDAQGHVKLNGADMSALGGAIASDGQAKPAP